MLRVDTLDARGRRVRGWNTYSIDRRPQIETRRQLFVIEPPGRPARQARFTLRRRYWLADQLPALFRRDGLAVTQVFGGYEGRAPTAAAEQRLYVLRPQQL